MTVGTLRDQVIYPHLTDDFRRRGCADSDLQDILDKVCTTVLSICHTCLCFILIFCEALHQYVLFQ